MIYLHIDFEFDPLPDIVEHTTGWEQLFLNIEHKNQNSKKYIIGNVYRVPNELVGNCNNFADEFLNLLTRYIHYIIQHTLAVILT